jgi:hypothetical protein
LKLDKKNIKNSFIQIPLIMNSISCQAYIVNVLD